MSKRDDERKKKEKKQTDWLTAQIMAILEKSMKTALYTALNEILQDWK